MPGSIYVRVEVLLRGFAWADAVARVVVGKDVAVDSSAEANVETTHLAKVDGVAMREEHCKSKSQYKQVTGASGYSEKMCLLLPSVLQFLL